MALSDIIQKIINDAQQEAEIIGKSAEAEVAEIMSKNNQKIDDLKKSIHLKTEDKTKEMIKKTTTLAEVERKNLLLAKKRKILTMVLQKSLEKFLDLPNGEMEKIFTSVLKNITEKEGHIYPAKDQIEIIKNALKNSGRNFKIAEGKNFKGGFLFINENTEIDYSIQSIINKEVFPLVELEIAKVLFSNS